MHAWNVLARQFNEQKLLADRMMLSRLSFTDYRETVWPDNAHAVRSMSRECTIDPEIATLRAHRSPLHQEYLKRSWCRMLASVTPVRRCGHEHEISSSLSACRWTGLRRPSRCFGGRHWLVDAGFRRSGYSVRDCPTAMVRSRVERRCTQSRSVPRRGAAGDCRCGLRLRRVPPVNTVPARAQVEAASLPPGFVALETLTRSSSSVSARLDWGLAGCGQCPDVLVWRYVVGCGRGPVSACRGGIGRQHGTKKRLADGPQRYL